MWRFARVSLYHKQCFNKNSWSRRAASTLLQRIALANRANEVALICDTHSSHRSQLNSHYPTHKTILTYKDVDQQSSALAEQLRKLPDQPIGAFTKPTIPFVIALLASWKAHRPFVPLSTTHSSNELQYFLQNSQLSTIVCSRRNDLPAQAHEIGPVTIMEIEDDLLHSDHVNDTNKSFHPPVGDSPALIVYTSGTTGRPKGVVHTHGTLQAQITSLVQFWEYSAHDRILHFLPLYHMHGLLNKLFCMLYAGGTVQFLPSASAATIWRQLADENESSNHQTEGKLLHPLSLFMAVPTVYAKMIEFASKLSDHEKKAAIATMKRLRLMVSGSAALPDTILHKWKALTGHTLLERYGMTELGMVLSNPYRGERKVGSVGVPLPNVHVRLVDDLTNEVVDTVDHPGELQVRGPTVFKEYLHNSIETAKTFEGHWFRTGDIAVREQDGYFRILGRASSDIIKVSSFGVWGLRG